MKGLRVWIQLLAMVIVFVFAQRAHAQPVYINDYLLQGEAIGTVIDIDPSVRVRSEKTIVDVRGWVPSLTNPILRATTTYEIETEDSQPFSLFSLNASKEPTIVFNGERVRAFGCTISTESNFSTTTVSKCVDTINNPLGVLLSKEQLMGYNLSNRIVDSWSEYLGVSTRIRCTG